MLNLEKLWSLHHPVLPKHLKRLKKDLKDQLNSTLPGNQLSLTDYEQSIINSIKAKTEQFNVNNLTRTQAYLSFYLNHTEIHWAFLGHMVSRNGGWNMTDLKGEFLPEILSAEERTHYFLFLERGNWLIFQDAYPQFLIYEESKKQQRPLFYLLPFFGVSIFMETVWKYFWNSFDNYSLAIAQVVNEQNYLEGRLIQNHHYQQTVLDTLEFQVQDLFKFNQILFPLPDQSGKQVKLIGQTLQHFASLRERVMLGKRLYELLFASESRLQRITKWAESTPHSGSRKDYWNQLFHDIRENLPGNNLKRKIKNCQLINNSAKLYSPPLNYAWENIFHTKADGKDWFEDPAIVHYLIRESYEVKGAVQHLYCENLEKIEMAAMAKKILFS
ncbi:DUF2515 domain-containing protein [Halobacillus salinarum]|uniref:DUF2515 domain-containing protein n=1 Tax=Halobacillus salinarum TaxID=2932257 RepID=A0ABY4EFF4_9BACI|nr:DUF2515 family protein [Halobacillus salinarum]UOQ42859.1 DUF2515 domain-containing protein [Halobacillus salinarum]